MFQKSALLFVLVAGCFLLPKTTSSSDNCEPPVATSALYSIEPSDQDTSPPGRTMVKMTDFRRGVTAKDSCGNLFRCGPTFGSLGFEIEPPADDQTPSEQLGYVVEVVEGEVFWREGHSGPRSPVLQAEKNWVWVVIADNESSSRELGFTVRAVDQAGNESEPSELVRVSAKAVTHGCG